MRLDSIRLINYRGHADLTVEFGPGFNAVVGVNGSGKTSLLAGISEVFAGLNYNKLNQPSPLEEAGLVRKLAFAVGGRTRFEEQYPIEVRATGQIAGRSSAWGWTRSSSVNSVGFLGTLAMQDLQGRDHALAPEAQLSDLPLIAFYRANRQWVQPQPEAIQAASERSARIDAYSNWWNASLDGSALQSWVIAKHLERLQATQETQQPIDSIDDELTLVNAALAAAVEGAKGIRYDIKERSLLTDWQVGAGTEQQTIAFENLSDGQRASIALIADIARRMCLLNPQLGTDAVAKTEGVVLIDELDMHLHPKWQRLITTGLKKAFPSIQFIVATHSPQVLGELEPGEIILLRFGQTSHPQVSYGLDSSRVLEEVMGTTARSAEIETALSELFARLEGNDLDAARNQLATLSTMAPDIPELVGAEALLKRKELLGR